MRNKTSAMQISDSRKLECVVVTLLLLQLEPLPWGSLNFLFSFQFSASVCSVKSITKLFHHRKKLAGSMCVLTVQCCAD